MPGFDGDTILENSVLRLIIHYGVRTIVETGVYEGRTLAAFARTGLPCHSIDIDHERIKWATGFVANFQNITIHHGNSPDVLKSLIPTLNTPVLYYLDAHSEKDTPILDELTEIAKWGKSPPPIIVIHDFRVPGTTLKCAYWYGRELGMDFVREHLDRVYEPATGVYSFNDETAVGSRVGVLFAVPFGASE